MVVLTASRTFLVKRIPLFVKYYASFNIISFTNFNLFKRFLIHKIISDKAKRLMPDKFILSCNSLPIYCISTPPAFLKNKQILYTAKHCICYYFFILYNIRLRSAALLFICFSRSLYLKMLKHSAI